MNSKNVMQNNQNNVNNIRTVFMMMRFSVVKTTDEVMTEGVDYCGPVKMSHKGFCLATLEKLMKHWPVGSYLVLNSTLRVPGGIPRMDIG